MSARRRSSRLTAAGVAVLLATLPLAALCRGQEVDTVIYAGAAGRTILDQIGNSLERQAFERLLAETVAEEKLAAAEAFLATYPRSWLLAQAYEIASKSAIERDHLDRALEYGEASLRLYPENPALLAPLANVAVQQGYLERAEAHARDGLEYLQRFGRPAQFSGDHWERTARGLESSLHYVLGRAAFTRGVALAGPGRERWLAHARSSLESARALNPDDLLAAFLLGLVYQELSDLDRAAMEFAAAAGTGSPVRKQAREELRKLYASRGSSRDSSAFEDYAATLASRARRRRAGLADTARAEQAPPRTAEYAGSPACRECHAEIYQSWSLTGMARMFRPYEESAILGDFEENNQFRTPQGEVLVRMSAEGGRRYFEFRDKKDGWRRFQVDYTIGSKWQQAYATRLSNGRIHVLPIQFSRLENRWLNFWELIDGGASERSQVERFPQLTLATSYQLHCAVCHTSQTRSKTGRQEPADIEFREPGINCESCHGPSAPHVASWKHSAGEPRPGATPVRFRYIDPRQSVRICAQCHMQSRIVDPGAHGELNYSGFAEPFAASFRSRPYNEFSILAVYRDGRFRETTFIAESFLRSACYRRGGATCVNCHDPHPPNAEANPKSLKFLDEPDQMCLQCHTAIRQRVQSHTRHAAGSEGSRCTACHMPKIMRSMLFQAGTHRIDDIPSAEMTARFGPEESPNACLLCHPDQDLDWLRKQLADWPSH